MCSSDLFRGEPQAGIGQATVLPLGLVRQPHRRTVLDLRPVAVGREQRELCPGAVLKIVWLAAGGLLGDGVTRFGQVTAGFVLHQTVFRDHQGQPTIDDGLRRDQLLDIPHLWELQLEGQAGGGERLAPEIIQRAAVEHVEAEVAADSQPRVPQKGQMADIPRQSGGDTQFFSVGQPPAELRFISDRKSVV